jgi:uncharacterized repeat protein (TIGR03806 family)
VKRTVTHAYFVLLVAACGEGGSGEPEYDPGPPPYEILSDWRFFEGDLVDQVPADDVIPYTVAAPLWADHAAKGRYFRLPEGGKIGFTDTNEWSFPLGTIFIKTFFFDTDRSRDDDEPQIVETRLLVNEEAGWTSYIYVWNDEQTEATRKKGGADVNLAYLDEAGQPATQLYLVPDQNTCKDCHVRDDVPKLLGPITHQLNVGTLAGAPIGGKEGNQIDLLAELGLFESPPGPASSLPAFVDPAGNADLDARARSYLHGNCAHCHRPGGGGGPSGLTFVAWEDDPAKFGVCKVPAAAGAGAGGRQVDIFPGDPERSIVPFRMGSTDPEIKMPELPSLLSDELGTMLIREWITAMPYPPCE